jgi:uncharacterized protein
MQSIYIASTEGSGGKTSISVGLALALRDRGLRVGYFKPVGAVAAGAEAPRVDEDAAFVADLLDLRESPADLCPVVLDENTLHQTLASPEADAMERVVAAFQRVTSGKDVVVCEGLGEIWQGRFLRVSGADVVQRLDLKALLVAKFAGTRQLDDICYVHDVLKERLLGVVFNMVPETRLEVVAHHYSAFLAENDIADFGAIPSNGLLSSVPVGDIATALHARYLCGQESAGRLVGSFMIGAMSPEHALTYFAKACDKAVVVGGDRDELVLAALRTSTAVVVLTGGFLPSAEVAAAARDAGVPLLTVDGDTVAAADGLRRLFGRLHVHERDKIAMIREVVEEHVDIDRLVAGLA